MADVKCYSILLFLLCFFNYYHPLIAADTDASPPSNGDKVLLRNITILVFHKDRLTKSRRNNVRAQIACVGGSAKCATIPSIVECLRKNNSTNNGATALEWDCKAYADSSFHISKYDVVCEGYSGPQDEYILEGSCRVEITIDYIGPTYQPQTGTGKGFLSALLANVITFLLCSVCCLLCCACSQAAQQQQQSRQFAAFPGSAMGLPMGQPAMGPPGMMPIQNAQQPGGQVVPPNQNNQGYILVPRYGGFAYYPTAGGNAPPGQNQQQQQPPEQQQQPKKQKPQQQQKEKNTETSD